MMNYAFTKRKIKGIYLPFEATPEKLSSTITNLRAIGISGLNVTVPYKEKIISYMDDLSQEAKIIGAVNTIEVRNRRLIGHNTDAKGFFLSLPDWIKRRLSKSSVLVIGAGGVSKAICSVLAKSVKKLVISNRTFLKAKRIAKPLKCKAIKLNSTVLRKEIKDSDIIVNAVSTNDILIPEDSLSRNHIIYDVNYFYPNLKKLAKKKGCFFVDGLNMLIYQASLSWEIWFKEKAPIKNMLKAIYKVKG